MPQPMPELAGDVPAQTVASAVTASGDPTGDGSESGIQFGAFPVEGTAVKPAAPPQLEAPSRRRKGGKSAPDDQPSEFIQDARRSDTWPQM